VYAIAGALEEKQISAGSVQGKKISFVDKEKAEDLNELISRA
jgi:hypothetical protein